MFCYVKKTPEVCPVLGENVTCANRSPILVFHCLTQNERKKLRKKRTLQKKERQTRTERQKRKQMKETKQRRKTVPQYLYSAVSHISTALATTPAAALKISGKRGSLKPVLSTTSPTVHNASRSFENIGRTLQIYFAQFEDSQILACEGIFRNTLQHFWSRLIGWFGLPAQC